MAHSRAPLIVIVTGLVALGAILWVNIEKLNEADQAPNEQRLGMNMPAGSLHEAAERGDTSPLKAAIAAGADVNIRITAGERWREGMTPLMCAARAGKDDAVKALLAANASLEPTSKDGKTALMYAAGWADASTVRLLLEANARVNARSDDGWTPLMWAATRGTPASTDALLAAGADVTFRNKWGQTALIAAARAGDAAKVKALLDHGADANDSDRDHESAVAHAAAADGGDEALRLLIEAKGEPNRANGDGVTPLMRAAERGSVSKVMMLLNAGARPEAKDLKGNTAVEWAMYRADKDGQAVAAIILDAIKK